MKMRATLPGRHLMIDGETLGTNHSPVFTQLAATEFWPTDPTRKGRTWSAHVDVADSLRLGRIVDAGALLFWLSEDAGMEARSALVLGQRSKDNPPIGWRDALVELAAFASAPSGRGMGHRPEGVAGVWSHGAAFDVARLETAYAELRLTCPWGFREQLCTRTLFRLAGSSLGKLAPPTGTKHDAVADAINQVEAVHAALAIIDGEG